jgi:hypothetical protein
VGSMWKATRNVWPKLNNLKAMLRNTNWVYSTGNVMKEIKAQIKSFSLLLFWHFTFLKSSSDPNWPKTGNCYWDLMSGIVKNWFEMYLAKGYVKFRLPLYIQVTLNLYLLCVRQSTIHTRVQTCL